MERGRWVVAAVCIVCAALVGAGFASGGGLQTGVLDPEQSATRDAALMLDPSVAYPRVFGGGGNIVRLYLYWNRVATGGSPADGTDPADPAYDWSQVDQQVRDATAAGLKVMLVFRSAPVWAQGAQADARGTFKPSAELLAEFATAAALRFNGGFDPGGPGGALPAVRWWEVWNEPNLAAFLKPQFSNGKPYSPGLYRRLLNAAAPAIHDVNGANVVVAGNTAPFGNTGNIKPLVFLRNLLCMTGRGHPRPSCNSKVEADVFAHHPYTNGDPSHHALDPDNISLGDLPDWTRLIKAAARAGHIRRHDGTPKRSVGLWATELGWDTKPPDPEAVPLRLHARWTAEALYRVWGAGLSVAIWTQMRDYPLSETDLVFGAYQAGLYFYNDEPKLSRKAFRFPFVAYAANGRISAWGRTPNGLPGRVVIERNTSSGWKRVLALDTKGNGIFSRAWSSSRSTGYYRARLVGDALPSVQFSLVRPPDRFVVPFGCGGGNPCS